MVNAVDRGQDWLYGSTVMFITVHLVEKSINLRPLKTTNPIKVDCVRTHQEQY